MSEPGWYGKRFKEIEAHAAADAHDRWYGTPAKRREAEIRQIVAEYRSGDVAFVGGRGYVEMLSDLLRLLDAERAAAAMDRVMEGLA